MIRKTHINPQKGCFSYLMKVQRKLGEITMTINHLYSVTK